MHPWPPIGENIARLRTLAGLTQEGLAERAEVSADLIRRLEQGNRQTALISNLYKVANALDVQLSVLLAQSPVLQLVEPDDHNIRIDALRRVLQPVSTQAAEEPEPFTLDDLQKSSFDASRLYQAGELANLATLLPPAIVAARHLVGELSGHARDKALKETSRLLSIGAELLAHVGCADLGFDAAREAVAVAKQADDALLPVGATRVMAFVLVRQGRLAEAETLAVHTAEAHEPRFGRATAAELATWGRIIWIGLAAAVRQGRQSQARDLLNLMEIAAHRIGTDHVDDHLAWFGPTTVGMQAVGFTVGCGEYGKALALAKRVPSKGGASVLGHMRHRLDIANAQAHEQQVNSAVASLMDVRRYAPEWMRYQMLARETVAMLLEMGGVSRERGVELGALAKFLYVAA